jgi:vancomycin resistance protein YoaR
MADKKMELDLEIPGYDKKPKFSLKKLLSKKFNKIFLIVSAGVLVAALAVAAVLLLGRPQEVVRIIDFNTAMNGASVGGIDISGMTREQAVEATSQLETDMLAAVKVSLSVNGEIYEYGPSQLSITTDYTDVINQAMDYGHTGTIDEREAAAGAPKNFDIKLTVDESALSASLAYIKSTLDTPPQDATTVFTPWGHTADGTPFTPDVDTLKEIANAHSRGKEYDGHPEFVTIPDTELPNIYRYEYYDTNHFEAGYIRKTKTFEADYRPPHANISRFIYTPESEGIIADMSSAADQIKDQVQSGKFETITVNCQVVEPAVKLADLQKDTQLITSWTSSYRSHYGRDRNYNVSMMSSLINGAVIMPGEQWTVNETAGPRKAGTIYGWHQAEGIENGGYTPQYGGGVCQLGSTTYNAALRAASDTGLKVVSFRHHSIPSEYEPPGLDATLSTPSPDLVLENNGTLPYYIVSYVNRSEKNVTVEIYGPSLTDPATGQDVICTYTSRYTGAYGPEPVSRIQYVGPEPYEAPDGTIIDGVEMSEYQFAKDRQGITAKIWKLIYSLDGTQLSETVYDSRVIYNTINGLRYIWSATGAEPTPTPTPGPSTTPTPPGPSTTPTPPGPSPSS